MPEYSTSGSITSSGTTWTMTPSQGSRPEKPPKGLIVTKAVQTQQGWLAQVFVDSDIVWESAVYLEDGDAAIDAANLVVVESFKSLLKVTGAVIDAELEEG